MASRGKSKNSPMVGLAKQFSAITGELSELKFCCVALKQLSVYLMKLRLFELAEMQAS